MAAVEAQLLHPMDRPLQSGRFPKRWRRLAVGAAVVIAVLVALLTFIGPPTQTLKVSGDTLTIGAVRQDMFRDFLPSRAEVAPAETVFIDSVEGGRVEVIAARDGQLVAAGELLARFSNSQLTLEATSREAEISERLSGLGAQELALEQNRLQLQKEIGDTSYNKLRANRDYRIRSDLHGKGLVSDMGLSIARDESDYFDRRLATLREGESSQAASGRRQEAQIRETAARLQQNLAVVRDSLRALEVRAPVAGRLTGFDLKPGQLVNKGDRLGEVGSEGAYKLIADIDEYYVGRVRVGQAATATVEGRPARLSVARVFPQVREGRFRVELAFVTPPPEGIRRGQTIDARITLGGDRRALVAPMGPWLSQTGGAWILVVDKDGRSAERRRISVGRRNTEQVEILSGLRPGEKVVSSDYALFGEVETLRITR